MKVLSVTSECVPLVKTGGLADVAGALPGALAPHGVEMRTLLPGYRAVLAALPPSQVVWQSERLFGGTAQLLQGQVGPLRLYVLDAPHLFDRPGGPYGDATGADWPDNPERFAALSHVGAQIAAGALDWVPDIVHGHDWQAGLTPYYVAKHQIGTPTVMTIHNIAFTGSTGQDRMRGLGLDPADFTPEGFEFYGRVSTLKAGLVWADKITTVSPTYASELTRSEFGMGLEGLMQARRDDLVGILNGIDESVWSPGSDPHITTYATPRGKAANKAALVREFGLPAAPGPLCVVVSRLSSQKGLDLLLDAVGSLTAAGGQLILLGSGDKALEEGWLREAHANPNVAVKIGYDEALSHRMMAGGDAILIPSRFEPCGLTQLYGLRYGTVPLVAYTGGLVDTVIPASPAALDAGVATGLHVHPLSSDVLRAALRRLCDLYADRGQWERLQRNGMAQSVGWGRSALAYSELYKEMIAAT